MSEEVAFASLPNVGAALHDRSWVDLGLCNGVVLQRVRVVALIVRRENDEVVVEQLAPLPDSIQRDEHTFDAEDVAWLRPTQVGPLDVSPINPPREVPSGEDEVRSGLDIDPDERTLLDVIVNATKVTLEDPMVANPSNDRKGLWARKVAMWCAFEMTNLSPPEITKHFNYRSPMPLQSVRYEIEGGAAGLDTAVCRVAAVVEKTLGTKPRTARARGSTRVVLP